MMDHALAVAIPELLIAAAYLWFAFRCFLAMKGAPSRAQRAWAALLIVSGLCALNGYAAPALSALLSIDPSEPWLSALRYWGHWLLALVSWVLAMSSTPEILSRSLETAPGRS